MAMEQGATPMSIVIEAVIALSLGVVFSTDRRVDRGGGLQVRAGGTGQSSIKETSIT